ncbi:MAG: response regulator transcription factor [Chitinophagaceae bacterium]
MKVKCLLVDDEPLAIQLLSNHIAQLGSFEVVGTCSNAIEALNVLRSTKVDLLFLDIKMPKITGIDFLRSIKDPPSVIVTTAYREYAIEGYDLDLVDYLLKPITFERFFKAVERYLRDRSPGKGKTTSDEEARFVNVRSDRKFQRINVDEIIYVESVKDYIVIHLISKKITAKYKIGDFELSLPSKSFLRVHRSFIVNLRRIDAFTMNEIEIGAVVVPIGINYKDQVMKTLNQSAYDRNDGDGEMVGGGG